MIYMILEGKQRHHIFLRFSYNDSTVIVYFVKDLLTTRVTNLPVDRQVIKHDLSWHKVFLKLAVIQ
jgi:hypothetical protein